MTITIALVLFIVVCVVLRYRYLRNGDWHPGRFDEMRRYGPNGLETRRMGSGD